MDSYEIIRILKITADMHRNEKHGEGEINTSKVCLEAANHIEELSNEIKRLQEIVAKS